MFEIMALDKTLKYLPNIGQILERFDLDQIPNKILID
jgi:hypothetical protein